ncbi:DUF721 domain-containing protein [Candidatus Babeliales bacterium]|nr:DUF721 domain-containing protein [Candidatus Babeliales bacterium]
MKLKTKELLLQLVEKEHHWKMRLRLAWHRIVGDMHHHVKIEKIMGNTLILGVKHPAWAQELSMLVDDLIDKTNAFLKMPKIKKIRFSTIQFDNPNNDSENKTNQDDGQLSVLSVKHRRYHATLTSAEKKRLRSIRCSGLKASLSNFYLSCKRRMHNEKSNKHVCTGNSDMFN